MKRQGAGRAGSQRRQPPSGGCVLKLRAFDGISARARAAAFGRLCVETPATVGEMRTFRQPPSGGCVLKRQAGCTFFRRVEAAAFGRLCVETSNSTNFHMEDNAAAFGRLCVETLPISSRITPLPWQPPSGGCVLKLSRHCPRRRRFRQPPSGGCVLKPSRIDLIRRRKLQPPSGGCVLKQPGWT